MEAAPVHQEIENVNRSKVNLTAAQIALRFLGFAVLATICNLAVQELIVRGLPTAPVMASILGGTIVGFGVKFVLDKWYVFYDANDGVRQEARKVTIYALCSVLTTAIFWIIELGAWKIWGTPFAKYTGAVIGLAIGYAVKYGLDVRYVFTRANT